MSNLRRIVSALLSLILTLTIVTGFSTTASAEPDQDNSSSSTVVRQRAINCTDTRCESLWHSTKAKKKDRIKAYQRDNCKKPPAAITLRKGGRTYNVQVDSYRVMAPKGSVFKRVETWPWGKEVKRIKTKEKNQCYDTNTAPDELTTTIRILKRGKS